VCILRLRFGELLIKDEKVTSFQEKPQMGQGWINGGYCVIQPEFFDLISGDATTLEREPLEQPALTGSSWLSVHHGFWQGMDTKRDRDMLEEFWRIQGMRHG
jgi:glucose-1-phosphate cytidylyltransferase